ncbi:MAG: hypothetical protein OEU26_00580 [Candidatus Tectomicrobia bacterium]|nr:hypothetical protein [Candidatus Tectomicrobia bacterium]
MPPKGLSHAAGRGRCPRGMFCRQAARPADQNVECSDLGGLVAIGEDTGPIPLLPLTNCPPA